jgi:hypothetical protein
MTDPGTPDGEARALLAVAENLTGLILDDHDPQIFIKEESTSPVPDDDRFMMEILKSPSSSPPQKMSPIAARKASVAAQRSSRPGGKGASKAGQLKATPAPGQPVVPRKNQDWEPWKGILYELYITQNRILRDIIGIMETKHNVRATSKMYKSQLESRPFLRSFHPRSCSEQDNLGTTGLTILSRHAGAFSNTPSRADRGPRPTRQTTRARTTLSTTLSSYQETNYYTPTAGHAVYSAGSQPSAVLSTGTLTWTRATSR